MKRIFDAHCDTISKLFNQGAELKKSNLHLDLERMSKFYTYIQVFAAFIDKNKVVGSYVNYALKLFDKYYFEIEKNKGLINPILSSDDLTNTENGGVYSILSIEGGEMLEGSLSTISMFYRLGVRLITLTWNYANEISDGICEARGGGLTDFGKSAVKMMEDLGILIDVSHISEKGFWDVYENTKYPFIASHSCVKSLCSHSRNLNDEQISAIIKRNGVIGINFYPDFLSDDKVADINTIVKHIEYILKMGGENVLAFGSDFDGVSHLPQGISGVQDIYKIIDALSYKGFDSTLCDKIAYKNLYRIFYETLSR